MGLTDHLLILYLSVDFNGVLAQHEQRTLPMSQSQSVAVGDPLSFVINASFQTKCPFWSPCYSSQQKNNTRDLCRACDREIFASNMYQLYQRWFLSPLLLSLWLPQSKTRGLQTKITYFWWYRKWNVIQLSISHRKPLFNFLFVQPDFQINRKLPSFVYVCDNLIELIDQTDLLVVAFWHLLHMEISVQKGWQTISGVWNNVNTKVA